jgi:hypothetical protein
MQAAGLFSVPTQTAKSILAPNAELGLHINVSDASCIRDQAHQPLADVFDFVVIM